LTEIKRSGTLENLVSVKLQLQEETGTKVRKIFSQRNERFYKILYFFNLPDELKIE